MGSVNAVSSFAVSFVPALPVAGQSIVAHVTAGSTQFCLSDPVSITQAGTTLTVSITTGDSCVQGNTATYRDVTLASLPAASYTFVLQLCQNNPLPLPSGCNIVVQAPLIIATA